MRDPVFGYVVASVLAVLACLTQHYAHAQQNQDAVRSGPAYAQADIELGSRLYAANCASCHGANGDAVGNVNLRTGQFRRAATDQELQRIITNGLPGTGMPAHKLNPSELIGIVAYLRNMRDFDGRAVVLGDATFGKAVFEGKGGCMTCHRINGKGSYAAPDLSDIGSIRTAATLLGSLLDPNSAMMPINRPVRAVTKEGKVITGRRLNEDTYTVQIFDDQEHFVSLVKAELREYMILLKSPMPSYKDTLSSEERAAVVAYLLTLKGL